MGLCPMPQQGTLFPAPVLRFAAVLIRLFSIYREAINASGRVQGTQFPARGLGAAPPRKEPMFLADQWLDYEVLDCGGGEKLERWGDVYLRRPIRRRFGPRAIRRSGVRHRRIIIAAIRAAGSWEFSRSCLTAG